MYITKYHITIPVSNKKYILVHTLTGKMFVLDDKEYSEFYQFNVSGLSSTQINTKSVLIQKLIKYNFIFNKKDDEESLICKVENQSRKQYEIEQSRIDYATFVLTYNCNFRCPYCYEKESNTCNSYKTISKEMVDTVFNIHKNNLKYIMLYGGEPLLPENDSIIRYIISKAPGATYYATTNGYNLEEFFPIFQNLNIGHIMVTFDGERDIHNKTRILQNGCGTYDKILRGVSLYLKNNITIKIRMNISNENIISCLQHRDNLINLFSESYQNKKLQFEMQPLFQLDLENKMKLESILYFPHKDNEIIKPVESNKNVITRSLSPLVSIFSHPQKFVPKYCNCAAETSARLYDADGNIYSCLLALGKTTASIGTYYPEYKLKPNSMIYRNINTILQCRECELKYLCGGGCANKILTTDGYALIPNCSLIKHEINHEVAFLYEKYVEKRIKT